MLKSEFEKRHGKIYGYRNAIVDGWITPLTKKYDLENMDQPASIWHIVQNMPDDHFGKLDLKAIQTIFEHLGNVNPKELREYYLKTLDHRFFSSGWGWFDRGGRGLSTFVRPIEKIPEDEKKLAVRVLKCLKQGFKKYRYSPAYGNIKYIDSLILSYDGTLNGVADYKKGQAKIQEAISEGKKLPRKKKKEVKKSGIWTLFSDRSK